MVIGGTTVEWVEDGGVRGASDSKARGGAAAGLGRAVSFGDGVYE